MELLPTKVLVRDLHWSDRYLDKLQVAIETILKHYELQLENDHRVIGEDSIELFTEENIKLFPELGELKEQFIDGFYDLACAYDTNTWTRSAIARMVANHTGRLPIMKPGEYKLSHSHPGASAFGIFYLTTVDNKKEGGTLLLQDPSFSNNLGFRDKPKQKIETKRGRLVCAPANVWHEVTTYEGTEDRIAVVVNLVIFKESDLDRCDEEI